MTNNIVLPFDELPLSLRELPQTGREGWHHVLFSGNPPHSPYVYGWILRLGRHTTPLEKAWLKANGFTFHGGTWCREDPPAVEAR